METPAPKRIVVAVALAGGLLLPGPSSPRGPDFGPAGTEPEANQIRLTVSGRGIVRSDVPNFFACGSVPPATACGTILTRGLVTLRATPAAALGLRQVDRRPRLRSSSTCRVDVSARRSIAATFRRSSIPAGTSMLRVRVTGSLIGGSVTVNGSEGRTECVRSFPNRSTVELFADETVLQSWSGSRVGAGGTCILVMSGAEMTSAGLSQLQGTHGVVRVTRSGPGKVEKLPARDRLWHRPRLQRQLLGPAAGEADRDADGFPLPRDLAREELLRPDVLGRSPLRGDTGRGRVRRRHGRAESHAVRRRRGQRDQRSGRDQLRHRLHEALRPWHARHAAAAGADGVPIRRLGRCL